MNLHKVLAIKPFRITLQIHKGYASFFVMSFSSRPLQIFIRFNCRFKDNRIKALTGQVWHRAVWLILIISLILSKTLAAELASPGWVEGAGFQWQPLASIRGTGTGFVRLSNDVTGVRFTNQLSEFVGASNRVLYNGAGLAAGDVDGDEKVDLFFCDLSGRNRFYRNLGDFRFEDVTAKWGMEELIPETRGAVLVDLNGDSFLDLSLSVNGIGWLSFTNSGNGQMVPGFRPPPRSRAFGSTSMAVADIDGDGDLDVYVAGYRSEDIRDKGKVQMQMKDGQPVIAGGEPDRFLLVEGQLQERGQEDELWMNQGNGQFVRDSWTSGRWRDEEGRPLTRAPKDWGLSAAFRDVNGDRAPDLYVCNDYWTPDRFWINDGKGGFKAIATTLLNKTSASSMSVDFGDLNRDGFVDLLVVDMLSRFPAVRKRQAPGQNVSLMVPGANEVRPQVLRNTLFFGSESGRFREAAYWSGLAATDWSWATLFVDVDLDGWEDLLIGAGHFRDVQDMDAEGEIQKRQKTRLEFKSEADRQKAFTEELAAHFRIYPELRFPIGAWKNSGQGRFTEVTSKWGFTEAGVYHGLVLADLDGDGDLDLIGNPLNQEAVIYRNEAASGRIKVVLKGKDWNTSGIGAKVTLEGANVKQTGEIVAGGRYLAGGESVVVFATGVKPEGMRLLVDWRNGTRSQIENVVAGRTYRIHETQTKTSEASARNLPVQNTVQWFAEKQLPELKLTLVEGEVERVSQPMLPFIRGNGGPGVAWVDANSDGYEDLLIGLQVGSGLPIIINSGGAAWSNADANPGVIVSTNQPLTIATFPLHQKVKVGVVTSDVGFVGHQHTILTGYELSDGKLVPKDYAFGGTGVGQRMAWADPLGDGKWKLFVCGGASSGKYPIGAASRWFMWENGKWTYDARVSGQFQNLGIVNDCVWSDLDGDGISELVLVIEWGEIKVYANRNRRWVETTREWGLSGRNGLWTSVASGDLNGDGRMDLVVGNYGENTGYKASESEPLVFVHGEIWRPGQHEVIETEWESGKLVPSLDSARLAKGLPFLIERFGSARALAEAGIEPILGDRAALTRRVTATTLASAVFLNLGKNFSKQELPSEVQWAPVFGVGIGDWNGDGIEDLVLTQNSDGRTREDGRWDSGGVVLLEGDGTGSFQIVPASVSGVSIEGTTRAVARGDYNRDGRYDLAIANEVGHVRLFEGRLGASGLAVSLEGTENSWGIGAALRLVKDGVEMGPTYEVRAGGGSRGQNSKTVLLRTRGQGEGLRIRWPGGRVTNTPIPENIRAITVSSTGTTF